MFSGRPSMMFPCVFAGSCQARALFFMRFFVFFRVLDYLLVFGRPALLLFCIVDLRGHIFVPAGAARPPTRRQMGSPSRFFLFRGGRSRRLMPGGGDPEGKLERTRGPTSCRQNAYRDSHRATTQKDNSSQMSGNEIRNCSKRALVFIKSSKHKGGYIYT